ncbi:plastocyanin/azurin family copper-binding protein [Pontibacter burrus]|uniref:Azurin n=1 Tax=Pontibacter burrus TaxID=2704466 RepID=A0A6B3LZR4_9BACT|nr:plastocyanin/azurin family copper-binding protein [Pontibacter burrus]NEM98921.1 azurin [Pontibacter burrus]
MTDTAATIAVEADTTLQPVVELTLRAIGNNQEEIHYDQDTLVVPADALVSLTLINEGTELTMIHNFVVTVKDKYKEVALAGAEVASPGNYIPDSELVLTGTPLALPGQTVHHEFKAPPPGEYSFVCTYPDHWKKMRGVLIVKETR